jgi:hypothetical protein
LHKLMFRKAVVSGKQKQSGALVVFKTRNVHSQPIVCVSSFQ